MLKIFRKRFLIQRRAGNAFPISYTEKPITEKIAAISREASIDQNPPGKPSISLWFISYEIFKFLMKLKLYWRFMRVFGLCGVQVKVRFNFLKILFFHFDIELHWSLILCHRGSICHHFGKRPFSHVDPKPIRLLWLQWCWWQFNIDDFIMVTV